MEELAGFHVRAAGWPFTGQPAGLPPPDLVPLMPTHATAAVKHPLPVLPGWALQVLGIPLLALAVIASQGHAAANDRVQVQTLTNLQADASMAQRQRTPILIALFASYCEYCQRVEQEFLRPMLLSGEYRDKVIIRKLETDSHSYFTGLDGKPVKAGQFSYRYDAYLAPTLIFIDHHGNELTERMIGLTTPEMYGGYLDNAVDQAQSRYRAQNGDD
jgi:thioredoxin-related protein